MPDSVSGYSDEGQAGCGSSDRDLYSVSYEFSCVLFTDLQEDIGGCSPDELYYCDVS